MTTEVLRNLLKKPYTLDYPRKKSAVSRNFRGRIYVDRKKCIGCRMCQLNCPAGAIIVDEKTRKARVDLGRCILCSLCAEVCPVKCIHFKNEYENQVRKRKDLREK